MSMPRPWPTEAEALAIPVGELALHVLWRLVSTPQILDRVATRTESDSDPAER